MKSDYPYNESTLKHKIVGPRKFSIPLEQVVSGVWICPSFFLINSICSQFPTGDREMILLRQIFILQLEKIGMVKEYAFTP